jgi:hypothetical protein
MRKRRASPERASADAKSFGFAFRGTSSLAPQGRGKPALVLFGSDETKNRMRLEFEISAQLAERLRVYRDEVAPKVTGRRPDAVFVTWSRTAHLGPRPSLRGRPNTGCCVARGCS